MQANLLHNNIEIG